MGMAASQARLLSITARLTDNENSGQSVSYSKQRLADQTQQITNEYNEALDATKLTVLTGFNGAQANYEDISYGLMTGKMMASNTRQYVVTDAKGKILVTDEIAKAYEKSNGNFNKFLASISDTNGKKYSQADITVQRDSTDKDALEKTAQQIHEAWDKYFESIGFELNDLTEKQTDDHNAMFENGYEFTWVNTWATNNNGDYIDEKGNVVNTPTYSNIGDGYAAYLRTDGGYEPINYEGHSQESKDLYDYAMAITEAFCRIDDNGQPNVNAVYKLDDFNSTADPTYNSDIKYYKNIFNKIQSSGYFTYTNKPSEIDENHLYTSEGTGTKGNVKKNPLKDNYTFEAALRDGTLRLEYYSTTDNAFKSTTISEDNCIQEVKDERAIAKAESKYNQDMADLESKDNKLDLQLKKLDTEHTALQTEYDSVKSVIDKNVESSFKIFS